MQENDFKLLQLGLKKLNIAFSATELKKLESFIKELILFNSRFDLINAKTVQDIIIKHILDSLVAYNFFTDPKIKTIADIGSGAGFPGVPLSIFFCEKNFTLIERSERRVSFLHNIKAVLKLQNVQIVNASFEQYNEIFSAVTTRALTTLNSKILKSLVNLLDENASLIMYKGNFEKAATEIEKLKAEIKKNDLLVSLTKVKVPFLDNARCIVKIQRYS